MFKEIQETLRLSSNIARAMGIYCPLKTLYIDDSVTSANKIKNALTVIPNTSYIIDSATNLCSALAFCRKNNYDCLLVREGHLSAFDEIHIEPLIIVSDSLLDLNKWKLGYTLNDMILESLNQTSFIKLPPNEQQSAA